MRILVLAKRPMAMRWGDALRFVNLARHWRGEHALELLAFVKPAQELDQESREVFERVDLLPYPEPQRASLGERVLQAFSAAHFMPASEAMRSEIAARLAAARYELVFDLGGLMLANLPEGRLPVPLVVDSIDEPLLTFEREMRQAPWSKRPALMRKMRQYEHVNREIHARASVNVYASQLDSESYLRAFPGARVESIPNGVDSEYFHPRPELAEPGRIAFEGNMMFGPNVDAASFLCREILPELDALRAAVRVDLIGREPAQAVQALADERIFVSGTLDDVRGALWRASVFICPMRLGAGIKNKVLQAWAMGIPVVATPAAMGGLDAIEGSNVLVREDARGLAMAVHTLLSQPELAARLAANGRRSAVERYSWKAQAQRFDALFRAH